MSVSPADIKARFPAFASESNDRIQIFITDASLSINRTRWGARADLGTMYLAAHLLACSPSQAAIDSGISSGVVQSEKVGDLTTTYAIAQIPASESNASLSSTSYGREYLRLARQVLCTPIVVNQRGSI